MQTTRSRSSFVLLSTAALLAGCGPSYDVAPEVPDPGHGDAPPAAEADDTNAPTSENGASSSPDFEHPRLGACDQGDAEACDEVGVALLEGDGVPKQPETGLDYLRKSCDDGFARACFNSGLVLFTGKLVASDDKEALQRFEKACDGGHGKGCLQAGFMHTRGKGTSASTKAGMPYFEKGCSLGNVKSCKNIGILLAQGKGVKKDEKRAKTYFAKACKAGDDESCSFEKELDEPATPTVPNANLTMSKVSADGFTVRNLSCRADGLGLLGGIVLAGSMAKRKKQLDRCAPGGAEPLVWWKFSNNRVTSATVESDDPKLKACVERAVKGAMMTGSGACVATFVIGK
jgi:hypothetical protein